MDIVMEMIRSFINQEVLSYDHNTIDDTDISKLQSSKHIYSTGNEEDVVLEPYVDGERVCITRPKGVAGKYFYFYSRVIEDFNICIPFTNFESNLLKTLNVTPSQLHPNGWGFIKAFEIVYKAMNIIHA